MPKDTSFHDYVMQDLFFGMRGIQSRSMFGGWGLYKDGVIFGIIAWNEVYFKVDEKLRDVYKKKGGKPFTYKHKTHSKPTTMSYWSVPESVLEDRDVLKDWVQKSVEVNKKLK